MHRQRRRNLRHGLRRVLQLPSQKRKSPDEDLDTVSNPERRPDEPSLTVSSDADSETGQGAPSTSSSSLPSSKSSSAGTTSSVQPKPSHGGTTSATASSVTEEKYVSSLESTNQSETRQHLIMIDHSKSAFGPFDSITTQVRKGLQMDGCQRERQLFRLARVSEGGEQQR